MMTLTAQFTMKAGQVQGALALVQAVKVQADTEQPGTLLYLVHRVLDKEKKPTPQLLFYECYRDEQALNAHFGRGEA